MATWVDYRGMQVPDSSTGDAGIRLTDNFTELAERAAPVNFTATTDPDANDDVDAGFYAGSHWLNTATPEMWICLDNTADAAVWQSIGGVTSNAREVLTANRTYYVRTDGSDSNDGLSNTSGGAFLTVQHAIDTIMCIDMRTYNVTVQVADGTYTTPIFVNGPWPGSGQVFIVGNQSTPANVVFSTTSADTIRVQNCGRLEISGFELRTTTSGACLRVITGSRLDFGIGIRFGNSAEQHMFAHTSGNIVCVQNYSIVGGAINHFVTTSTGVILCVGATVTLTGTPAFSHAFAYATTSGFILANNNTYSGSASGSRFYIATLGNIDVGGAGASYFPGNSSGTTQTGGQYN